MVRTVDPCGCGGDALRAAGRPFDHGVEPRDCWGLVRRNGFVRREPLVRQQFPFVDAPLNDYIRHCDRSTSENGNGCKDMLRSAVAISLFALIGCTDQSRDVAFNECRMKSYLEDPATQGGVISDCMKARSFQIVLPCSPEPGDNEWDWQAGTSASDPKCYRATGALARTATILSPM